MHGPSINAIAAQNTANVSVGDRGHHKKRKRNLDGEVEEANEGAVSVDSDALGEFELGLDITANKVRKRRKRFLDASIQAVKQASGQASKLAKDPLARANNIGDVPRVTVR